MEGVVESDRVGHREVSQAGKCWKTFLKNAVDLWPPVEATRVFPAFQHLSMVVDDIIVALDYIGGVKFCVAAFVNDTHGEEVMASDAAVVAHIAEACNVQGADVGCKRVLTMVCVAW